MHTAILLTAFLLGTVTNVFAAPGLRKRAKISTDGTCSSDITCVGSGYGDCCSSYGFCGSSADYCGTSGTPSTRSTPSASSALSAPSTPSTLKISQDGSCGKGVTCQGSSFGNCCSQYGYCGSSASHCGSGCQPSLGTCDTSSSPAASSSNAAVQSSVIPSASGKAASSPAASNVASKSSTASTSPATTTCNITPTQAVVNPSFEDGLSPWTTTGGAVLKANGEDTAWYFTTNTGSKYMQMESSKTYPSSSFTQGLSNMGFAMGTVSFDWQYQVITTGRGPPSTVCTLTAKFGSYVVASWTRPGSQGGKGHVESTFSMNFGAGDLTFDFSCTSTDYRAGVLVDNVRFTTSC